MSKWILPAITFFGSLAAAAIPPLSAFQPVSQKDPSLSDLFSVHRKSELCGPIVLANILKHQKTRYSRLAVRGSTEDLVRKLFVRCRTHREGGTRLRDLISCTQKFYQDSGYQFPMIKIIGPDRFFNPNDASLVKKVTFRDITEQLRRGYSVILEIGWYKLDIATKSWYQAGGHYVWVVGYSNRKLRIVNPEIDYSKSQKPYDEIEWLAQPSDPSIQNPPGSNYFLRGRGFDREATRAFAKYLIVANPEF